MTDPREVTVSDDLVKIFREAAMRADYLAMPGEWISDVEIRAGLAAAIAARVPGVPKTMPPPFAETVDDGYRCGALDFRDKALKGV